MNKTKFDEIYEELLLDPKYSYFTDMAYEWGELPINKKYADLILSDVDDKEKLKAKFINIDNPNKRYGYAECECGCTTIHVEARCGIIINYIGDFIFEPSTHFGSNIICPECHSSIIDMKNSNLYVKWEN